MLAASRLSAIAAVVLPNFERLARPIYRFDELAYVPSLPTHWRERIPYEEPVVVLDGLESESPTEDDDRAGTISGFRYCMRDDGSLLYVSIAGEWATDAATGVIRRTTTATFTLDNSEADQLAMVNVAQVLHMRMARLGLSAAAQAAAHALHTL